MRSTHQNENEFIWAREVLICDANIWSGVNSPTEPVSVTDTERKLFMSAQDIWIWSWHGPNVRRRVMTRANQKVRFGHQGASGELTSVPVNSALHSCSSLNSHSHLGTSCMPQYPLRGRSTGIDGRKKNNNNRKNTPHSVTEETPLPRPLRTRCAANWLRPLSSAIQQITRRAFPQYLPALAAGKDINTWSLCVHAQTPWSITIVLQWRHMSGEAQIGYIWCYFQQMLINSNRKQML